MSGVSRVDTLIGGERVVGASDNGWGSGYEAAVRRVTQSREENGGAVDEADDARRAREMMMMG
jgi:hypothetical protein